MKKIIGPKIAYRLINPGPLLLVSSLYDDKADITPIAGHMPVSRDPGMIALEIHKNHFIHKCITRTGRPWPL